MKKSFRKVLSLTLAMTMIFALGLTANAAGKNDSGWGDYRYWSTWGNWNESDAEGSVPVTLTGDPSSYYMPQRSEENHEMAPAYYMEKSFFPTTVPGVYAVSSVPVAVRTPAHQLLNSFGGKEGYGLIARFYDLPAQSTNAKAMLDAKAAEIGGTVVGYFDGSFALVDSNDKLSELPETSATYELFLGIGSNNPDYKLCAIRVREGGDVAVLEDMHPDTNILSIETTPNVASYAVVCAPAGTAVPAATEEKAADTKVDTQAAAPAVSMADVRATFKGDDATSKFIATLSDEQLGYLLAAGGLDIAGTGATGDAAATKLIETLNADQLVLLLSLAK